MGKNITTSVVVLNVLDFAVVLANKLANKVISGNASEVGRWFSLLYEKTDCIKKDYRLKGNPFRESSMVKYQLYNPQLATNYANQKERDGLGETEKDDKYISVLANFLYYHPENKNYYVSVMADTKQSIAYLDGHELTNEEKAILAPFKKAKKATPFTSQKYKKLFLTNSLITIDGITYKVVPTPNELENCIQVAVSKVAVSK